MKIDETYTDLSLEYVIYAPYPYTSAQAYAETE